MSEILKENQLLNNSNLALRKEPLKVTSELEEIRNVC